MVQLFRSFILCYNTAFVHGLLRAFILRALRPGKTDQHCFLTLDSFNRLSLLARFATSKFFKHFMFGKHILHVGKQKFLIKHFCLSANKCCLFCACSPISPCRFGYWRNWQTKMTKLHILMLDKQCWPVSPGLYILDQILKQDSQFLELLCFQGWTFSV